MIQCKQHIAILLATYNGKNYLREQIDSIIRQTFTDWHLYVHDDGSADGTIHIIKEYEKRFPEQITVLDYPSQGGASCNFFSLLERIDAPYYMFCDQDDVWFDHKIQTCYDRIRQLEHIHTATPIIVHSDLTIVDSQLQIIDHSFIRNQKIKIEKVNRFIDYAFTNTVTGCTMLFNAAAVKCIKYPRSPARMHDSWITMSVVAKGGIVHFIEQPLIYYRQHGNNTLGAIELSKITPWTKLKNTASAIKEIISHYHEMNTIQQIPFFCYLWARIRYKLS